MPLDIDFCPIELPGHGQRIGEMAVTHLDTLVPTLQAVLEPLLTIPFAFFGHSTGACIAFEAARVLRAIDGRSATHLVVSGRPAPDRAIGHRSIHSLSDQDLVAAPPQLSRERDSRKRMARIAEGGDEQPQLSL